MTTSLMLAFLWVILANISAMIPSKDNFWTRAYFLIATGVPLLVYVTYDNGPVWGLAFLIAGASILRWPLVYMARWVRRMIKGQGRNNT